MAEATNICGVAVYLAPDRASDLMDRILALPGVELEAASGENRLALTVVDTAASLAIDQIAAMHRLPGVVAASLIFHAFDAPDDESAVETAAAACCGGLCQESGAHARASAI
ncbi:chaperone NapD [Bradyrhizobium sp. GCM10027634]|uniref:chaperone NapD n=1 Tax=unclassified Bradyrhizobium TaxID=2631580 RepID=UPI00188BF198|nr:MULTISPECIES: chaperone NapD [unclassified Bradyrhizobium]MDN4999993.1 chaperone NapD [Bradyrhizobium sp. WYCCWR 12677]